MNWNLLLQVLEDVATVVVGQNGVPAVVVDVAKLTTAIAKQVENETAQASAAPSVADVLAPAKAAAGVAS